MSGRIQEEIKQRRPLDSLQEEAYLNIQRTSDMLTQRFLDVMRPAELTETQYNVLRILRGASDAGLNCKDIGSRMITREPDITRLLDRLEKRNLITRNRSNEDRRHLNIRITQEGLDLLSSLDQPVRDMVQVSMNGVASERLEALISALEEVRSTLDDKNLNT